MKHRVIFILLLLFAIWPLVHYGLVQRYQLDPWKYGGWAMYVVAVRNPEVSATVKGIGQWRSLSLEQANDEVSLELKRWQLLRKTQGFLMEPTELGRAILQQDAGNQAVRITVDDFDLDRETGLVKISTYVYDYAR